LESGGAVTAHDLGQRRHRLQQFDLRPHATRHYPCIKVASWPLRVSRPGEPALACTQGTSSAPDSADIGDGIRWPWKRHVMANPWIPGTSGVKETCGTEEREGVPCRASPSQDHHRRAPADSRRRDAVIVTSIPLRLLLRLSEGGFPIWWWMSMLGWIWMIIFWGAIVGLIVRVARRLSPSRAPTSGGPVPPLAIAKTRYARGEITREQFEELKGTWGADRLIMCGLDQLVLGGLPLPHRSI
jgi:uncharacterized membrane protein